MRVCVRSLWVLIDVDGCCFELRGRLEEYTGTDVELWCVFDNERRREEKRRGWLVRSLGRRKGEVTRIGVTMIKNDQKKVEGEWGSEEKGEKQTNKQINK